MGWVPGIDIHLCWEVISFSCRKPFTTAADFCEGNKYFDMCFFDADTPLIGYLESNLPFIKGKTPRLSLFTIIIPKPFCSSCIESNTSLQYTHENELAGKRLPTQGAYKTEVHPSFKQQSITLWHASEEPKTAVLEESQRTIVLLHFESGHTWHVLSTLHL